MALSAALYGGTAFLGTAMGIEVGRLRAELMLAYSCSAAPSMMHAATARYPMINADDGGLVVAKKPTQ